jgi:dipeptidyl aminopeptidase/acylaminoacyl peptidase
MRYFFARRKIMNGMRKVVFSIILVLIFAFSLSAQGEKKVLTLEDYPQWKHILSPSISADGDWISYSLRPNGGDAILYFKSNVSDKIYDIPYGSGAKFSEDSRWAAYLVGVSKEEAKKLQKDKKPVPTKGELLNLASGEKYTIENTEAIDFPKNSKYFSAKKAKLDKTAKHNGTDLVLRNLETGISQNIGNVGEHLFNKPGTMLAYVVDAANKGGNGVYLMNLTTGRFIPLDTGEADYAQIAWDEKGTALAFLKGKLEKGRWERDNVLLAFTGLEGESSVRHEFDPTKDPEFPKEMVISERVPPRRGRGFGPARTTENRALIWSEDLSRVFCGIKQQEKKPEKSKEDLPDVDIWHWKDEQIQSVQTRRFEYDVNFTYLSVFLLKEKKFLQLADKNMRTITLTQDGNWGVGRDAMPYLSDVETMQADYYLVNPITGERRAIVKGIRRSLGISPNNRYFLYLKDKQLWIYDFAKSTTTNISAEAPVVFVNEEDDHPDEKSPFGLAGWTKDNKSVMVNHKYDLWLLPLDGGEPSNILGGLGDKDKIQFRYVRLDPEEKFIDTSKPLLLSAYGDWTKKSGYYSLKVGDEPKRLFLLDKSFGTPRKAKKADKILYTIETFAEFPDYYVSDLSFKDQKKVTDANPQQKDFAWGRRILVDYTNSKGQKLQATLALPAGYEEGKKYPMLVYFYEKMSQRHHQYSMPTYDDRPHMSAYASDGYLVLMPDIIFEIGKPGTSSLDCVSSAVKKVIELGFADPERIGLQGHSWGGFQTSFIVTQTDMFACVVSGAPPTCIEGEFNQVFKSSGNNNHSYYSRSQGRMGTDPWKDHELYRSQSAIQNADKITTPFMLLHGTEDGSVDWIQSLEYFNAARYLGKEVIFLSYPGEPHHLAKEENQKDFQLRMKQYFDHYLKGKPMPDWMANGISYMKKKRRLDAQKEQDKH